MKLGGAAAKIGAIVRLAGLVFALFVLVTLPFEVAKMLSAEAWPSRQGVIEVSYASRRSSAEQAPSYVPEICGRLLRPGDPKETVLESQPRWNVVLTLGGIALFFLVTPFVLWLFRRRPVESAWD